MLNQVSKHIANCLCGPSSKSQEYQICSYGIELALHTFLSTLGLLLIGLAMHRVAEAFIVVLIFYTNQTTGGGYHATTHIKCFLAMAAGMLLCLLTTYIFLPEIILYLLIIFAASYLWIHPVCLHKNKLYLQFEIATLKRKARIVVLASSVAAVCMGFWVKTPSVLQCGSIAMVASCISRAFGLAYSKHANQ